MIDANGERLAYRRAGQGEPLVLIHSLGTNAQLWDEQIARWSRRFDVIAVSARGHGGSTNRGGVTMAALAEDLRAVLGQLGVARANFVGLSMGGLICARLHALAPALMGRLVISGSFVTLGAPGLQRVRDLEQRLPALGMARYGEVYAAETLLPSTPRRYHDALAGWIAATDQAAYLQTARSIFGEDVGPCMGAMRLPVRVLVGAQDQRTPVAHARHIAETIPGATLEIIDGAGHLANLDAADRFCAAVEAHLVPEPG